MPTADFVTALSSLSVDCEFGTMANDMIREHVVEATVHPKLREGFLQDKTLTLDRVMEQADA